MANNLADGAGHGAGRRGLLHAAFNDALSTAWRAGLAVMVKHGDPQKVDL